MKQSATTKAEQKKQMPAEAEADYRAGVDSVCAVARKHGLSESTLRREAARLGWVRASQDERRRLVSETMAGAHVARELTDEKVRQVQVDATAQDVYDMNTGLAVARKVLGKLLDIIDLLEDPRDLKVVVEANRAAVETIRKIRSLDAEPAPTQTTVSIDVSNGFAELHAAFDKHLLSNIQD